MKLCPTILPHYAVDAYCAPAWILTSSELGSCPALLLEPPFALSQIGHLLGLMGSLGPHRLPSKKEDTALITSIALPLTSLL